MKKVLNAEMVPASIICVFVTGRRTVRIPVMRWTVLMIQGVSLLDSCILLLKNISFLFHLFWDNNLHFIVLSGPKSCFQFIKPGHNRISVEFVSKFNLKTLTKNRAWQYKFRFAVVGWYSHTHTIFWYLKKSIFGNL